MPMYNVLKEAYDKGGCGLMQINNYQLYLEKTAEASSDKVKKSLVKKFLEVGIATKDEKVSGQLCLDHVESLDISGKTLTDQLIYCIRHSEKARFLFEQWEFKKDYKYSVIFTCDDFPALLQKIVRIDPLDGVYENEYTSDSFTAPVAFHMNDYSFLKFNLTFAAIHPQSQEEFLLKYPFVVVFHKEGELIEFRFDVVKRLYISGKKETTVYSDMILAVKQYLAVHYECSLNSLNMDFMVNVSKNDSNVKLIAQYMKLPRGGNAQLEVGNNQEYILPFIGELKTLLADHQADLEKVSNLREALEQFMYEMEEMSDYPWIELLWENEIKTRCIRVKFVFNYMSNDYCFIQHYYSNFLIGMERMNYVIKYIIDHRNDDTR